MSDLQRAPAGVAPARPAAPPRFLRTASLVALAVLLGFLILLNAASSAPVIRDSLGPLVLEHKVVSSVAGVITLLAAVLLPLAVLMFSNRHGWLRWPQLTALWIFTLGGFTYLVWDEETVRRPLTMDELSPALSGDEATFQILLRYAKDSEAAKAFKSPDAKTLIGPATNHIVPQPEKWAQFLREHRSEIEAGWTELTPVRAWWDELAAQPRIGDLTPPRWDAPLIAFQPVRTYSQFAVAVASLQAIDGHGDAAADTLLRLYTVARKLEPNSRTLVRTMIAKVIQKMALQTTGFVLDHAAVSPARKTALATEISSAIDGPAGARRVMLIEYAYFGPLLSQFVTGVQIPLTLNDGERLMQRVIQPFSRVVVNPIATQNLVGDRYYQLAALAEERRLGELEASKGAINRDFAGGYHVKNIGGRLIADMAMPALSKVVKSYWDTEDLRLATLNRLKA